MFRVILPQDRFRHRGLITEMFDLRSRARDAGTRWDRAMGPAGVFEDRYDTRNTVYVVVVEHGLVEACARLNPTTRPHMLSEVDPAFCNLQPLPSGGDVWECSRVTVAPEAGADRLRLYTLRCHLGIGITTCCFDQKIRRLSWLTQQKFYNAMAGIYRTEPLGLPRRTPDGVAWIAGVSDVELVCLDRQMERLRRAPELAARLSDSPVDPG